MSRSTRASVEEPAPAAGDVAWTVLGHEVVRRARNVEDAPEILRPHWTELLAINPTATVYVVKVDGGVGLLAVNGRES